MICWNCGGADGQMSEKSSMFFPPHCALASQSAYFSCCAGRRKIVWWSTTSEDWSYGRYFYVYSTKPQKHNSKLQTVPRHQNNSWFFATMCTDTTQRQKQSTEDGKSDSSQIIYRKQRQLCAVRVAALQPPLLPLLAFTAGLLWSCLCSNL